MLPDVSDPLVVVFGSSISVVVPSLPDVSSPLVVVLAYAVGTLASLSLLTLLTLLTEETLLTLLTEETLRTVVLKIELSGLGVLRLHLQFSMYLARRFLCWRRRSARHGCILLPCMHFYYHLSY